MLHANEAKELIIGFTYRFFNSLDAKNNAGSAFEPTFTPTKKIIISWLRNIVVRRMTSTDLKFWDHCCNSVKHHISYMSVKVITLCRRENGSRLVTPTPPS